MVISPMASMETAKKVMLHSLHLRVPFGSILLTLIPGSTSPLTPDSGLYTSKLPANTQHK